MLIAHPGDGTHPDPDDEGNACGGGAADLGDTALMLLLSMLFASLVHKLLIETRFFLQPPRAFLAASPTVLPARIKQRCNMRILHCCCGQLPPSFCSCLKSWVSEDLPF